MKLELELERNNNRPLIENELINGFVNIYKENEVDKVSFEEISSRMRLLLISSTQSLVEYKDLPLIRENSFTFIHQQFQIQSSFVKNQDQMQIPVKIRVGSLQDQLLAGLVYINVILLIQGQSFPYKLDSQQLQFQYQNPLDNKKQIYNCVLECPVVKQSNIQVTTHLCNNQRFYLIQLSSLQIADKIIIDKINLIQDAQLLPVKVPSGCTIESYQSHSILVQSDLLNPTSLFLDISCISYIKNDPIYSQQILKLFIDSSIASTQNLKYLPVRKPSHTHIPSQQSSPNGLKFKIKILSQSVSKDQKLTVNISLHNCSDKAIKDIKINLMPDFERLQHQTKFKSVHVTAEQFLEEWGNQIELRQPDFISCINEMHVEQLLPNEYFDRQVDFIMLKDPIDEMFTKFTPNIKVQFVNVIYHPHIDNLFIQVQRDHQQVEE